MEDHAWFIKKYVRCWISLHNDSKKKSNCACGQSSYGLGHLYVEQQYFFSIWNIDIIKYLQNCEGDTQFCEILYKLILNIKTLKEWNRKVQSVIVGEMQVLMVLAWMVPVNPFLWETYSLHWVTEHHHMVQQQPPEDQYEQNQWAAVDFCCMSLSVLVHESIPFMYSHVWTKKLILIEDLYDQHSFQVSTQDLCHQLSSWPNVKHAHNHPSVSQLWCWVMARKVCLQHSDVDLEIKFLS